MIFKLNRQSAAGLSDEAVHRDREYWRKTVQPILGDWLTERTSLQEIAAFAEKTYGRQDFDGFRGDLEYIRNDYSQTMYSKARADIAGLYMWRASNDAGSADKERMAREADFAFRQAWALGAACPEATFRYVNFFLSQSRFDEALLVGETALKIAQARGENDGELEQLISTVEKMAGPNRPIRMPPDEIAVRWNKPPAWSREVLIYAQKSAADFWPEARNDRPEAGSTNDLKNSLSPPRR